MPRTGDNAESSIAGARDVYLAAITLLLGIGVIVVHSGSMTSRPTDFEQIYLSRHLIYLVIALVCGAVAAHVPMRLWQREAWGLWLATAVLLVAVLVPSIGTEVNGARRWLRYGGMSFQPSELAKITLPLLVCSIAVRPLCSTFRGRMLHRLQLAAPILITFLLVVPEPDLGSAVFLLGGSAIALFLAGWPLRDFLLAGLLAVPAVTTLVAFKPYQLERLAGFIRTWTDPGTAPYQVRQSLTTLGVGGLTGTGLGRGWQKLSFLPEANTDFVFAVLGEEAGLIGTLTVLGLWVTILLAGRCLLEPVRRGSFAWVFGLTLLIQLVIQALINVAVVTAMLPPKGISHPLLSYGGSNLVVSLTMLGLVRSASRPGEQHSRR